MPEKKTSIINVLFVFLMSSAIIYAAFTGKMQNITDSGFQAAKDAVTLSISLIGITSLWLGLIRILEAGGFMKKMASTIRPLTCKIFKDVPPDHPAMSAIVLNISANMLGLGNAAIPLGIKAMIELNKLNPIKGVATNAMCLFLTINASGVTLFPLGIISVRAAAGAGRPAEVFLPILLATIASTIIGVCFSLFLANRDFRYINQAECAKRNKAPSVSMLSNCSGTRKTEDFKYLTTQAGKGGKLVSFAFFFLFGSALFFNLYTSSSRSLFSLNDLFSFWIMPGLIMIIFCYGLQSGVLIYEAMVDGAKQGFKIAVRIIPFLVVILVAIAMFRVSGAMGLFVDIISPVAACINMPADAVPMAIIRPLSGSGAFGIMAALVRENPNSYSSFVASTMQGSTETSFYILAVYFGSVGIVKIRHALLASLLADVSSMVFSCLICSFMWQG